MTALADAVAGELVGWTGLPSDLDPEALGAAIGASWTPEPGTRARAGSAFAVLHGAREVPPEHVDAWVRVGEPSVTAVEFRPPVLLDNAALLEDLGEPELTLTSNHFEVGASVREHVHAERGITVAVAEPFPDADGEAGDPWIVYVQLYPPTTTQEFVTRIGQSGDALRPYPRPPA